MQQNFTHSERLRFYWTIELFKIQLYLQTYHLEYQTSVANEKARYLTFENTIIPRDQIVAKIWSL